MTNNFSKNVFINCPFDSEYISLLRPLLFTILYLGYNPRIASESSDSGKIRFQKICELIEQSRISIHDLSRIRSSKAKGMMMDRENLRLFSWLRCQKSFKSFVLLNMRRLFPPLLR